MIFMQDVRTPKTFDSEKIALEQNIVSNLSGFLFQTWIMYCSAVRLSLNCFSPVGLPWKYGEIKQEQIL